MKTKNVYTLVIKLGDFNNLILKKNCDNHGWTL